MPPLVKGPVNNANGSESSDASFSSQGHGLVTGEACIILNTANENVAAIPVCPVDFLSVARARHTTEPRRCRQAKQQRNRGCHDKQSATHHGGILQESQRRRRRGRGDSRHLSPGNVHRFSGACSSCIAAVGRASGQPNSCFPCYLNPCRRSHSSKSKWKAPNRRRAANRTADQCSSCSISCLFEIVAS